MAALAAWLKPGGRFLFLGYPKERYDLYGCKNGAEFGRLTDGERTPWCEWYDEKKIRALFGPEFRLIWSRNFGQSNIEFNWFDLTKISDLSLSNVLDSPCEIKIPIVSVQDLHNSLDYNIPINYPEASLKKPLSQWKMEVDDAPIFRYLYRNFRPKRHLEFGTWQGRGVTYVLEECDATVWTINLLVGERKEDGSYEYGVSPEERDSAMAWARRLGMAQLQSTCITDSLGFIGRYYLERGLGHRVCQIYCDSRQWDTSAYPAGFFDSILIDGGHQRDVVLNDTRKALPLLRSGGLIMWHDFCPPIFQHFEVTRGVMQAIFLLWPDLQAQMRLLFWIQPSWILLGVKR